MITLEDIKNWELYDDQTGEGFTHIGFTDFAGGEHIETIEFDLASQIDEVKRKFGDDIEVRLLLM